MQLYEKCQYSIPEAIALDTQNCMVTMLPQEGDIYATGQKERTGDLVTLDTLTLRHTVYL